MANYGIVRCNTCDQVLDNKVQIFDKGKIWCDDCNYRVNKLTGTTKKE